MDLSGLFAGPQFTQPNLEQVLVQSSPMDLNLDDNMLISLIEQKITDTKTFNTSQINLDTRQKNNEKFWLGQHIDTSKFHTHQIPYVDNMIWQDTENRIQLAAGRMPDFIITPGDGSMDGRDRARKVERVINMELTDSKIKRIVKNGLRHNHIYMIGVVKARWDPTKGPFGDFVFEVVRPEKLLLSSTTTIPEDGFTMDNCDMAMEWIDEPVDVVMAKFPGKATELMRELSGQNRSERPSSMRYQEVWFTTYQHGKPIEGLCWKYKNLILGKMRNPYFDFEGYERQVYGPDGNARFTPAGTPETQKTYRNYFERPRKPYILFSYQNLGRSAYDDTTPIEQSIPLQRIVNKRGRQITEIADRMTDKFAFNNMIDKETARQVTTDPKEAIWINTDGDIRAAVTSFTTQGPPAVLYQDLITNRGQIDAKFSTHGTTRGETQGESGISKQISREGDLVTSDDIVEVVVERVLQEMGSWALQFMKLLYVVPHMKKYLGKDGDLVLEELQRDDVDDGISVTVDSSASDRQQMKIIAKEMLAGQSTDPYTAYEDMDMPNPKERTARLLAFVNGGADGFTTYKQITGIAEDEMAGEFNKSTPTADQPGQTGQPGGLPGLPPELEALLGGGQPPSPEPTAPPAPQVPVAQPPVQGQPNATV